MTDDTVTACLSDPEATVVDGWCNHPGFRHRYGTKPTARETTLGALTAADLGKRVVMDGVDGPLGAVLHERLREGDVWVGVETLDGIVRRWCGSHPPTTPVTVHDEEDAS